jgi:hypothetical protein
VIDQRGHASSDKGAFPLHDLVRYNTRYKEKKILTIDNSQLGGA